MAPGAAARDSVSALLKKCQEAARNKKYDAALDLAGTALQTCERDRSVTAQTRVTLLDLRTALHIRLGHDELALKDAKAMIRIDRTDGRGYIRCGQIERRLGNRSAAQKFYEHGLKQVSAFHQYTQLIARELAAVKDELRTMTLLANAKDPMTTLPLEIVNIILGYLPYRQHMQMLRVCKAWNRMLRTLPPLTDTLAFPGAERAITPKMLHAALRRLKEPTTISACHLTEASSQILSRTLQRYQSLPMLQTLEIQDKWISVTGLPFSKYDLKSIIFGSSTAVPFDVIPKILKDCPNVEVAQFRNVTGSKPGENYLDRTGLKLESNILRVLQLQLVGIVVEFDHDKLFSGLPALESLSFTGLSCFQLPVPSKVIDLRHMERLEVLEAERGALPSFVLPKNIRKLRFTSVMFQEATLRDRRFDLHLAQQLNWEPGHGSLHNLQSLTVYDCPMYPIFLQEQAAEVEPGTLEEWIISISWESEAVTRFSFLLRTPWLKGLKRLHVRGEPVWDIYHREFLEYTPDLEELSLDSAEITTLFVADLIRGNPPNLRKIVLKNCLRVSNDVVPWAKEHGVEVEIVRNARDDRGRRLRYGD
ncbi:hypothetical protein ABEF92_007367 [Exophiala dermatitidis]|uniref:F-box domain-containing protein n=1 Tax=Exophiala dermatitidis (strain ATCC 34100 / CBS 525.76 / NIH/UT8656) TaxID=858893 RepID=H6BZV5_EXODN|nr:uncharacterized protein HMPREF1120_04376 [Exophiala dermatitidis NIH/UT8656]EHY56290.1 hypothetical protein HMPREF1120_04376 [Exophiala dermatitidis NIH/UT8656]